MIQAIKQRFRYWLRWDERTLTLLITSIFLVAVFFFMNGFLLPDTRFKTEEFEEIEFEKFIPPPPKKVEQPKDTPQPEPEPIAEAPVPTVLFDFKLLEQLSETPTQRENELLPFPSNQTTDFQIPDLQVQTPAINERAPVIKDQLGDIAILSSNEGTPDLDIETRSLNTNFSPIKGADVGPISVKGKKEVQDNITKIETKDMTEDEIDEALHELFMKLLAWLKENQSELSPALKAFLEYKPGDLTGRAKIQTETDVYELILICNESSQDVGILLVNIANDAVIYLRDVGFKRQSHYLSKGVAVRDQGAILSVGTREEAPTKSETSKFYSIFLTWWDTKQ